MDWGNCVVKGVAQLSCIPIIIKNIITWSLTLGVITAIFFIIFAGIKMIASNGDAKKLEDARKTLTYALIGLIIMFLAFFIVNSIAYLTGTDCIRLFTLTSCQAGSTGSGPPTR